MPALSPALYIDVELPDGRIKRKRDTAHELPCGNKLCKDTHQAARDNPGFDDKGNVLAIECGDDCHLER